MTLNLFDGKVRNLFDGKVMNYFFLRRVSCEGMKEIKVSQELEESKIGTIRMKESLTGVEMSSYACLITRKLHEKNRRRTSTKMRNVITCVKSLFDFLLLCLSLPSSLSLSFSLTICSVYCLPPYFFLTYSH